MKNGPDTDKNKRSSSLPIDILAEELEPFKKNLRTLHKGFYPPKDSLKDYKRK